MSTLEKIHETVESHFRGYFQLPAYHGEYGNEIGAIARRDFSMLTDSRISWAQVHGDFTDVAKRAMFQTYQHWPELYQAIKDVLEQHQQLGTFFNGAATCGKLMDDAMRLLKMRNGKNAPRWWIPLMKQVRNG